MGGTFLLAPSLFDTAAETVKRLQKSRTVARRKSGVIAFAFAGFAQMRTEVTHRRRHANIRWIEHAPRRPGHQRALCNTAARERHIGGYDDIVLTGMVGDPIIRGVETSRHDHIFYHRVARWAQTGIGNEGHLQAMPFRHLENFRLHGAGIGIDIDLRLL
ncbi:hypothetical protein AT6N2_C0810 [Agrobacterium tumefaciens]|nr:hypothetical protein AT6N2_C0810 [Agrobacterium tumefaciens]